MDYNQMKRRDPMLKLLDKGCLKGYKLDFTHYSSGWECGVADIVKDNKNEVWGLIYVLTEYGLHGLDRYEGYPIIYTRFQIPIIKATETISNVWTYSVVNKRNFIAPSNEYIKIIKKVASDYQFPEKYRLYLDSIKTN
jgi:gamma-glutamylcyclotransferase (GGCT)/AIG2-like uncharacterized protein YtfP